MVEVRVSVAVSSERLTYSVSEQLKRSLDVFKSFPEELSRGMRVAFQEPGDRDTRAKAFLCVPFTVHSG